MSFYEFSKEQIAKLAVRKRAQIYREYCDEIENIKSFYKSWFSRKIFGYEKKKDQAKRWRTSLERRLDRILDAAELCERAFLDEHDAEWIQR